MKSLKLLLVASSFLLTFGSFSQNNHVFTFSQANEEFFAYVLEYDTITVINQYQVGDFHYGYAGPLQNSFNVQIGDTICKFPVVFIDTITEFVVFYGSNPGVPFVVYLMKQYAGIDNLSSDFSFAIYPNPTSDILNIDTESLEEVKIYNLTGQLVLSADSGNKKIDISDLNAGTYLVQIGLHSKRLVIE
jgi:hypothetical protein